MKNEKMKNKKTMIMDSSFWRCKVYAAILGCSSNFYENLSDLHVFEPVCGCGYLSEILKIAIL